MDGARGGAGQDGTRRWLPRRLVVVALVLLVGLVVALLVRDRAGADAPVQVVTTYQGLPAGVDAGAEGPTGTDPGWIVGDDGRLAVWAAGSSTCPWLPVGLTADGDAVTVTLAVEDATACTMDLVFTTSVVALPDGVDPDAARVEIVLDR
jgi:hypothetical protein